MKTSVEFINPEKAKELLSFNDHNRKLKRNAVNEYARQMAAGLWKENSGESIKLSKDGQLLDGQQRLHALIKANASLSFLVVRDLDFDIFKVIDSGVKRTAGDVFYTSGVSDSNNVSAAIRKYYNLKIGYKQTEHTLTLSSDEALNIYNENPFLWDNVIINANMWYRNSRILSRSDYGGFYAFFREIHINDAFTFIDSLSSGIGLHPNNPIIILREKLISNLIKNKGFKIDNSYRQILIFKSWNLFRQNKNIKQLSISPNEKFPYPI